MKTSLLLKCACLSVVLPLFSGCIVYRDRPARVVVEAPAPPPPPQEIVTVAPGPRETWFWVAGCWEWRGHWVWAPGHWVARPHPGAVWVTSHWGWRGNHRVWISGCWQ